LVELGMRQLVSLDLAMLRECVLIQGVKLAPN
jgi:hypothetical protein